MDSIPKISIILPVFNSKTRISQCLETLINQTLHDIEIVVVLDCPNDGTDKIVLNYAKKDKRIIVIQNKEQMHIGNSRNIGLQSAHGEYIGFSDHDDFRELTMYECLYKAAKENDSDIVFSPCRHISLKKDKIVQHNSFDFSAQHDLQKYCLSDLIGNGNNEREESLFINIQGCIYRNEFIKKHHINFVDTKTTTPEDIIFQIDTFSKTTHICIQNDFLYTHVSHSSNEGIKSSYKNINKRCKGLSYIYANLPNNMYKENFYIYVQKQFLHLLAATIFPFPNIVKFLSYRKILRSYEFCIPAFKKNNLHHAKKGIKRLLRKFLCFCLR